MSLQKNKQLTVLHIAIPTYGRNAFLNRLLQSIIHSASLSSGILRINISIFDNNPNRGAYAIYAQWSSRIQSLQNIDKITYHGGERNIGCLLNVIRCYEYSSMQGYAKSHYAWVIGDDDAVSPGAISDIEEALANNTRCALIITGGASEDLLVRGSSLKGEHSSYHSLLTRTSSEYPEFPIHHTLITCNIVRCGIFDFSTAIQKIGTKYGQMYGLMHGLYSQTNPGCDQANVYVLPGVIASVPGSNFAIGGSIDSDIYREIPYRWAEYFTWLRCLWGIPTSNYDLKKALRSDAWPQERGY